MALSATRYEHVSLDEAGVPRITGTTTKVVELVANYLAGGSSPEELHLNFPHFTLGQIYSALAYYWDHQESLDDDLKRRLERVEKLQASLPTPPVVLRLRRSLRR